MRTVEFRLLGPFEIAASKPVSISRRRERSLLAVLLLEQGRVVQADQLAELLWDGLPPPAMDAALRSHVSRLRAALGPAVRITRQGGGYGLRTDPDRVDAHRFRSLVGQAGTETAPGRRAELLRAALRLWRGPALLDFGPGPIRERLGAGLEELRLVALEQRIEADLTAGRHTELIGELRELVDANLNRERFAAQLMLALYRSERQADALTVYDSTRRALADSFGLSPGSQLRDLHARILRADPALVPPEPNIVTRAEAPPRQLPNGIADFTGRTAELAELDGLASEDGAATIVSIDGAPGTGKTALAVHWAHRVAGRYPDAQLYLNLRGHGPGNPVGPEAATGTLLRGLGVAGELIPAGLDERSALLRSTLAGRRVLLLLDDARDGDQVRPLVPATTALVIVTSRAQLRSLAVRDGAHRVTVRPLPASQAVQLLARSIGTARVGAEPQATARLAELCDRLPLALAIVAERARHADTLAGVVDSLTDERARLDNLGVGPDDPHTDVRAALALSYRTLDRDAATMFRMLGLNPTGDIGERAAVALSGLPPAAASTALDQLVIAHLIEERRPGRYELHDLVRLYAAELAPAADREPAVRRLLDEYLHTAASADARLRPHRRRDFLDPHRPHPLREFADREEAMAWFEREHANLRAITTWAATHGFAGHAWRIALTMTTFFDCRIPWQDGLTFYRLALRAAESDDPMGPAYVLVTLGRIELDRGEPRRARSYFTAALARFEARTDLAGMAHVHGNLGLVHGRLGESADARRHFTQALRLCERLGYRRGIGHNLDNLGVALTVAGEYDLAIECLRQAVDINRELCDTFDQAETLHHLGQAYAGRADFPRAARAFRLAISYQRSLGNHRWEAVAVTDFARLLTKIGHGTIANAMLESVDASRLVPAQGL